MGNLKYLGVGHRLPVMLVALLALLGGCGKATKDAASTVHSSELVSAGTPALPFPSDRAALSLTEAALNGAETEERSANAVDDGDALVLDAAAGEFEFGLYRFNLGAPPLSVSVEFEEPATTEAWVAIADFSAQRWELEGPFADAQLLPLDAQRHVSPAGNTWIGIVAPGGESARVSVLKMEVQPLQSGWVIVDIESVSDALRINDIAIINGVPAIAYRQSLGSLGYAVSSTPSGSESSDWSRVTVADNLGGFAGLLYDLSLAQVNSTPAIAYLTNNPVQANYAFTEESDGLTGWSSLEIEVVGPLFVFNDRISLALADGRPAIAYFDQNSAALRFAGSSTEAGADPLDWNAITVDDDGSVGHYASMAVIGERPMVVYRSTVFPFSVKFASSTTGSGADPADWVIVTVIDDGAPLEGSSFSLAEVNGKPAFSFKFPPDRPQMGYAFSSAEDGTSGWSTVAIENVPFNFDVSSLAVINGFPAVVYESGPAGMKYAVSSEPDGSSGWASEFVFEGEDLSTGMWCALAELDNGQPAISFFDTKNASIRYAVLVP